MNRLAAGLSVDAFVRRARSDFEALVLRGRIDPVSARIARLARVARQIGLLGDLHPAAAPALVGLAMKSGLSVRTVHALHARLTPDRPALVDGRGCRTYAEVDREINRAAHALNEALGIQPGDAVGLAAENCAEYVILWFALMRLGARAVHVNDRSTASELFDLVGRARARAMLVSDASLDAALHLAHTRRNLVVISAGTKAKAALGWSDLLSRSTRDDLPNPPRHHAGSESVVYTSGTSGRPKGAVRDFARFGIVEGARLLERLPFRIGDRHLVVAPLHHSAAQAFTLINAALGATIVLHAHFSAQATIEALSRERIHSIFLVPTMIRRITELPSDMRSRFPTPELRALISGAAEFPETLRHAAIAMFGAPVVYDFYGATELGWVTLINGTEMLARPGSVGLPLPGQRVRILDEQGRRLPTGATGLIYVRNEQMMSGYLDDAAATARAHQGAWVTVDDLGRLDEDGYLYLSGRARDIVISGGVNLYPVEIESIIAQHPAVKEVAVIGLSDPEWGERLVAVVVPRSALESAELDRFTRDRLSSLKVPREWHFVDELPRNAIGKVLKRELVVRFGANTPR